MTDTQRFTSVWDALENTPQEAASMKARSALMMALISRLFRTRLNPIAAAATCAAALRSVSKLQRISFSAKSSLILFNFFQRNKVINSCQCRCIGWHLDYNAAAIVITGDYKSYNGQQ